MQKEVMELSSTVSTESGYAGRIYLLDYWVENISTFGGISAPVTSVYKTSNVSRKKSERESSRKEATCTQRLLIMIGEQQTNERPRKSTRIRSSSQILLYRGASKCKNESGGQVQLIHTVCSKEIVWCVLGRSSPIDNIERDSTTKQVSKARN